MSRTSRFIALFLLIALVWELGVHCDSILVHKVIDPRIPAHVFG